jgi:hypothetical protein
LGTHSITFKSRRILRHRKPSPGNKCDLISSVMCHLFMERLYPTCACMATKPACNSNCLLPLTFLKPFPQGLSDSLIRSVKLPKQLLTDYVQRAAHTSIVGRAMNLIRSSTFGASSTSMSHTGSCSGQGSTAVSGDEELPAWHTLSIEALSNNWLVTAVNVHSALFSG